MCVSVGVFVCVCICSGPRIEFSLSTALPGTVLISFFMNQISGQKDFMTAYEQTNKQKKQPKHFWLLVSYSFCDEQPKLRTTLEDFECKKIYLEDEKYK